MMLKDIAEGFAVYQKLRRSAFKEVEQLVAVSSRSEAEVFVLARRPPAVEVHRPSVHLQEVQGHVSRRVDLEGLEVGAAVDVVLEAERVDLLLPTQAVDGLLRNGRDEVFHLSDQGDQVSHRCLGRLRQRIRHEDHDFVGGRSVEAVLDHVGPFQLVLRKQPLEDMLDNLVVGWRRGLLRVNLCLGGKLSCF